MTQHDRPDEAAIRATIKPAHERLSVARCIGRGLWRVNVPVVLLIFGGGIVGALVGFSRPEGAPLEQHRLILAGTIFFALWLSAWTWWSWTVPHWRIWALQSAENWLAVKRRAIQVGLIWPDGVIFERTEIKSPALQHMERVLRRIRENEG